MKNTLTVDEKNRVIIRAWLAAYSNGEVGHISLEIPDLNIYISFWPEGNPNGKFLQSIIEKRKGVFLNNSDEDIQLEQRVPETLVCLYSLDINAMKKKLEELKKNTEGWTLFGENTFLMKGKQHSCASLVYQVLDAGGIYTVISLSNSSLPGVSSSTTPGMMDKIVKEYKFCEMKVSPVTKNYDVNFKPRFASYIDNNTNKKMDVVEKQTSVDSNPNWFFQRHPRITAVGIATTAVLAYKGCNII